MWPGSIDRLSNESYRWCPTISSSTNNLQTTTTVCCRARDSTTNGQRVFHRTICIIVYFERNLHTIIIIIIIFAYENLITRTVSTVNDISVIQCHRNVAGMCKPVCRSALTFDTFYEYTFVSSAPLVYYLLFYC